MQDSGWRPLQRHAVRYAIKAERSRYAAAGHFRSASSITLRSVWARSGHSILTHMGHGTGSGSMPHTGFVERHAAICSRQSEGAAVTTQNPNCLP